MLYTHSFVAMALANFCISASFSTFFLFPLFIADRGGSEGDIGIVMGVFALASALCRPWVSGMIDRIGRKKSFGIGSAAMSLLALVYLAFRGDLTDFYLPLLVVRILHGVGLALCFTAAFTYIADIVPVGRLNEGVGIFGISGLLGMAAGPVIAEAILNRFDFPVFFLAASGLAAAGFLLHLPVPETFVRHATSSPGAVSFFGVLKRQKMVVTALLALFFGFGLAASNFVAPMAGARQIPFFSLFFLSYSGAAVVTRFWGGPLADRVGEKRIIPYALVVAGAGLTTLALVEGVISLCLAGLLSGCGHGLLFPSLNALALRDEPPAVRGKVVGIYTGSIDSGNFSGSVMLGYIGEWAGYQALFLAAGLALFSGLVVLRRSKIL